MYNDEADEFIRVTFFSIDMTRYFYFISRLFEPGHFPQYEPLTILRVWHEYGARTLMEYFSHICKSIVI